MIIKSNDLRATLLSDHLRKITFLQSKIDKRSKNKSDF